MAQSAQTILEQLHAEVRARFEMSLQAELDATNQLVEARLTDQLNAAVERSAAAINEESSARAELEAFRAASAPAPVEEPQG